MLASMGLDMVHKLWEVDRLTLCKVGSCLEKSILCGGFKHFFLTPTRGNDPI